MTLRGASGKKRRRKQDAKHGATLERRHECAETVEGMRHLLAFETEKKRADRRMRLIVERSQRTFSERTKRELGQSTCRQSEDDRIEFVGRNGASVGGNNFPGPSGNDVRDGRISLNR